MAAISGTTLLLYSEGIAIAMQKGISIAMDIELPDATNKESAGWSRHILGHRNAKIDFSALADLGLIGDTPPVTMSAKALMDYILNKESLLIAILGLGVPIIGEVNMGSLSFDAPDGNVMTLSGNLTVNGNLYILRGTSVQMITDITGGGDDYDTFTTAEDIIITEATTATQASAKSNTISVANTGVYKLAVFLTLDSGQSPLVYLWDNTSAAISNQVRLADGLNLITLIATATDASASLAFINSSAASWSTSPIYLFKV
jgi:hypothetical protein